MKFSSFPWWSKLSEIETTQAVTDDISQTFLQTLDHVVATPASVEVPDLWAAQLFSKWMLFFIVDKGKNPEYKWVLYTVRKHDVTAKVNTR